MNKGTRVIKRSGNPFKSNLKVNTVKGYVTNHHDPKKRPAYTFYEDDSIVNCDICEEFKPTKEIKLEMGQESCPHCGMDYDLTDPDKIQELLTEITDYKVVKNPWFCEADGSCTWHMKCKHCGGLFYDEISWDM